MIEEIHAPFGSLRLVVPFLTGDRIVSLVSCGIVILDHGVLGKKDGEDGESNLL